MLKISTKNQEKGSCNFSLKTFLIEVNSGMIKTDPQKKIYSEFSNFELNKSYIRFFIEFHQEIFFLRFSISRKMLHFVKPIDRNGDHLIH